MLRAGGALNTQRGMLMKSYEAEGTDCYYLYPSFKKTIRYLKEELGHFKFFLHLFIPFSANRISPARLILS